MKKILTGSLVVLLAGAIGIAYGAIKTYSLLTLASLIKDDPSLIKELSEEERSNFVDFLKYMKGVSEKMQAKKYRSLESDIDTVIGLLIEAEG